MKPPGTALRNTHSFELDRLREWALLWKQLIDVEEQTTRTWSAATPQSTPGTSVQRLAEGAERHRASLARSIGEAGDSGVDTSRYVAESASLSAFTSRLARLASVDGAVEAVPATGEALPASTPPSVSAELDSIPDAVKSLAVRQVQVVGTIMAALKALREQSVRIGDNHIQMSATTEVLTARLTEVAGFGRHLGELLILERHLEVLADQFPVGPLRPLVSIVDPDELRRFRELLDRQTTELGFVVLAQRATALCRSASTVDDLDGCFAALDVALAELPSVRNPVLRDFWKKELSSYPVDEKARQRTVAAWRTPRRSVVSRLRRR